MYKTAEVSLPVNAEKFFSLFLSLYPKTYRKKFGSEMYFVLCDMYREEVAKNGKARTSFYIAQSIDISKSAIQQHGDMIKKQGMKKYLREIWHLNTYNVIGALLLLPIFVVFGIDFVSRIAQGDLLHYNRPVYAFLSHTFLYQTAVLFTWVILFPALAVLLNIVPLISFLRKKQMHFLSFSFIQQNVLSILLLLFGLGFIAFVRLHDVAPCVVHGIVARHIENLPQILSVCSNA